MCWLFNNGTAAGRPAPGLQCLPDWLQVVDRLQEAGTVGQALPVVCSQHPDTTNLIKTAEDFEVFVKEGGCSLPCTTRLLCGHTCPR